jgi:hypothetical protein
VGGLLCGDGAWVGGLVAGRVFHAGWAGRAWKEGRHRLLIWFRAITSINPHGRAACWCCYGISQYMAAAGSAMVSAEGWSGDYLGTP